MFMANDEIQPPKVRPLAARLIFAALKVLKENGGEMRGKQVMEEVEKRVQLGEWEKHRMSFKTWRRHCSEAWDTSRLSLRLRVRTAALTSSPTAILSAHPRLA